MQLNQAGMGLLYLQVAWETDPSVGQYWLTLTECLLEIGSYEDALLLIEDAIRRGMDSFEAQQLLIRARNCYDRAKLADTVASKIGKAVEASVERGAQATEPINSGHQQPPRN